MLTRKWFPIRDGYVKPTIPFVPDNDKLYRLGDKGSRGNQGFSPRTGQGVRTHASQLLDSHDARSSSGNAGLIRA
jgi:hypothetical protein